MAGNLTEFLMRAIATCEIIKARDAKAKYFNLFYRSKMEAMNSLFTDSETYSTPRQTNTS